MSEVNNGGHYQFYSNSTGIVWEDAITGFLTIGVQDNYKIIKSSADLIGGNKCEAEMYEKLRSYIKANAKDFYFDGEVKIPK